ncbi:hypothetical protein FACS1894110_25210 [Spirochaetia bacterium]|nr:hypothetical protein FACS1894110_25210 [Spirochaetia bacterium]
MGKYDRVSHRVGEPKIGEEAALETLRSILDFYEIGIDEKKPDESKAAAEAQFDDILEAIRWGEIEVDDEKSFAIVQRLSNGQAITYREITTEDFKFRSRLDINEETSAYKILGRLSGIGEDAIYKLKGQDRQNAARLALIFFMA